MIGNTPFVTVSRKQVLSAKKCTIAEIVAKTDEICGVEMLQGFTELARIHAQAAEYLSVTTTVQ
jgi:hypothetical protein